VLVRGTLEIVWLSTLIRKLWSSAVTVTTLRAWDHADLDALGGDQDGAALGHPPLRGYRTGGWCREAGCQAGSAEPVPIGGRDRAGRVEHGSFLHVQCAGRVCGPLGRLRCQVSMSGWMSQTFGSQ
jgi:hypothetical protein